MSKLCNQYTVFTEIGRADAYDISVWCSICGSQVISSAEVLQPSAFSLQQIREPPIIHFDTP